jgi:triacylglycerol lipase
MTCLLIIRSVFAMLRRDLRKCRTRFFAVWSELDGWIVPQRNARLDHPDLLVTNCQLSDVGHLSLPVDPRAVRVVVSTLAQLDPNQPPRERYMAAQV